MISHGAPTKGKLGPQVLFVNAGGGGKTDEEFRRVVSCGAERGVFLCEVPRRISSKSLNLNLRV